MIRTVKFFLPAEAVISLHKNSKDSLEILQLSGETPAAPRQCWDIMAQISVDPLYGKGVIFVVDIEDMLSRKDHIPEGAEGDSLHQSERTNRLSPSASPAGQKPHFTATWMEAAFSGRHSITSCLIPLPFA